LTTLFRLDRVTQRLKSAPGRSQNKMLAVLATRIPGSESYLEDFVLDAILRYELPMPVRQHCVVVGGRNRRIDLCYPPPVMLALEAKGFEYHGLRHRFDADALRGNELELADWRVLEFTSAFDDWTIAKHVAAKLRLDVGAPRHPILTFAEWKRLCRIRAHGPGSCTNGG
jgi:hypothetical protein